MKLIRSIAFTGVLLVGALGCESVVEDLNINPNEFTDISTGLLVNHSVLNMASIAESEAARIAGMWTDQFTGSDRQYISQDDYKVDDSDFDGVWEDLYRDGIVPSQIAQEKASAEDATGLLGIAQITEAFYAGEAASLFGDVPYTQANQATEFPDPVYDSQESVLRAAIALLDQGFDNTAANPTTNTPALAITGGNSVLTGEATWQELSRGLKARYLLILRDYEGALAAAQESFDEVEDEPRIIHTTTNFAENLFFQFEAEQRSDYLTFTGSYLTGVLQDSGAVSRADAKTDDANRLAFYTYTAGGFLRLNTNPGGYFAADQDFPVVSYPEVQLIIAETAQRTGDSELAIEALNNARNYWDELMGTDDYEDFDDSDFDDDNSLLEAILLEKFVSVFGTPTFYDVIRTNNIIGTNLDGRTTPAQRFLYPSVERSSNSSFPGIKTLDDPTPINM
ncbi:SusD/RagB family nutrient-binding outer membrane lipoprotein [Neolewinella sp.]|uniref:SusD/RagB family nutrient-binding outer membrane lipoprotein n=1 Tax=Neolewinella sp. TaxID=2993543 RepID=UPI003B517821